MTINWESEQKWCWSVCSKWLTLTANYHLARYKINFFSFWRTKQNNLQERWYYLLTNKSFMLPFHEHVGIWNSYKIISTQFINCGAILWPIKSCVPSMNGNFTQIYGTFMKSIHIVKNNFVFKPNSATIIIQYKPKRSRNRNPLFST